MNNPTFLIKRVIINNFRGYPQGDFEFFKDNSEKRGLILLGGSNGYGKTSLLDAIEWCLSGTIRRIQEDYEIRKEKSNNLQRGLIRHNPSKKEVSVLIEAEIQGQLFKLERSFNKELESEAFVVENTLLKVNEKELLNGTIDDVLNKKIADIFYDRYVCSYDKNIKIYEKSRDGIYQMFSAFFGGTQEIENVINNLEGYQIGRGKQKKIVYGVIKQLEEELNVLNFKKDEADKRLQQSTEQRKKHFDTVKEQGDLQDVLNIYPTNPVIKLTVSPHEIIESPLGYEQRLQQAREQKKVLENIQYLVEKAAAYNQGVKYIKHLEKTLLLQSFREELLNPFKKDEQVINQVQSLDIKVIKEQLIYFRGIEKSTPNIVRNSRKVKELLLDYAGKIFDAQHRIIQEINLLDLKIEEKEKLEVELKQYDTNNPVLKALRSLVDHLDGFQILHKSQHESCPLCGSKESFSNKELELAQDAKQILGDVDQKRNALQIQYNLLESELQKDQENIKKYIIDYISKEILHLEGLLTSYNQMENIRLACVKFQLNFNDLKMNTLQRIENELGKEVLDGADVSLVEQNIIKALSNNAYKLEGVPSTLTDKEDITVQEFLSLSPKGKKSVLEVFIKQYEINLNVGEKYINPSQIKNINRDTLKKQLKVLDYIGQYLLNDKIIRELDGEILKLKENFTEQESLYNNKVKEINKLKHLLSSLKKIRSDWDKKIAEEIRVPFKRMYKRLTRHTNINDIDLIKEGITNQKAKIVANVNSEEIFAPNILSAGQLSTMSLAIFLTVAMGQKNQSFRCYFMDEPIQTMDDLNVLSFVDLLRTELLRHKIEQNSFIDQLILTTCDEDFENLVHHKMKNFNVNFTHIHFTSYGEYEFKA
ncbi:AAA family ATPase [Bacillus pacificus]|uniref:AAA family ATPase n=1 Tax=Bacillus pacificus TaxID=2026187 RepID=UPI0023D8B0E6|nr:AAA family ATPase [Bacillus pacificus]MDF0736472.1 AAA family ATPase [Bacillus pacificus]